MITIPENISNHLHLGHSAYSSPWAGTKHVLPAVIPGFQSRADKLSKASALALFSHSAAYGFHFLLWLPPLQLPLRPWMCTPSAGQGWMVEILGPRSPWFCPTDPNPNTSSTSHPCRQHYPFPLDPTGLMPRIKTRLVGGCLGSGDSWCGRKSQDLYSKEWVWFMSWAANLISPMSLLFSWAKYNIFTGADMNILSKL